MNSILRHTVIVGCIAGSAVNMGIIMVSGSTIPLPDGPGIRCGRVRRSYFFQSKTR